MKKYLISILSFLIMLYVWSALFQSFLLSFTLLLCLACHEFGHMIAARQKGIDVSAPVFLPIGAFINMRSRPKNAEDEAYMALAGPIAGTAITFLIHVSALALLVFGIIDPLNAIYIVSATKLSYCLNLFNMIPFSPMDGGRAMQIISRHLWPLGAGLLIMMFISMNISSAISWFVLGLIIWSGMQDVQFRKLLAQHNPAYYRNSTRIRLAYFGMYAALLSFLLLTVVYFPDITRGLLHLLIGPSGIN